MLDTRVYSDDTEVKALEILAVFCVLCPLADRPLSLHAIAWRKPTSGIPGATGLRGGRCDPRAALPSLLPPLPARHLVWLRAPRSRSVARRVRAQDRRACA